MCQEWADESVPLQQPKTARARVNTRRAADAAADPLTPRSRERERIRITTPATPKPGVTKDSPLPKQAPRPAVADGPPAAKEAPTKPAAPAAEDPVPTPGCAI